MSDLIDDVFYSSLIGKPVRFRALVPEDGKPSSVLYLLHGLFGSHENWTELTGLQDYVANANLLVVMPEGGDNWYTDSAENYESYLIQDLLPAMEDRFGASRERARRAIAGNSMGGYGALKLAFRYPAMFGFAASFSGAFHATRYVGRADDELMPSISRVFGDFGSETRRANDVFEIAAAASDGPDPMPDIYFDCGTDDPFVKANREFSFTLSAVGVDHEFREVEGGHDWEYWDARIRHLLTILRDRPE